MEDFDITSLAWSDITLDGLSWQESGRDLVLHMRESVHGSASGRLDFASKGEIRFLCNEIEIAAH